MRKILLALSALFMVAAAPKQQPIVLTTTNTLTLFGEVNEGMVEHVANTLPKLGSTIYVNIVSPGGSIVAGKRIIDQLTAASNSGKKIVCIPHFAISMAFVILQSSACPVRLGLPSSVLMQHQPSLVIEGPFHNAVNQLEAFRIEVVELEKLQAERLKMPLHEFVTRTAFDMWLNSGEQALALKAIDSLGTVICSPDLLKSKRVDEIQGPFGITFKLEGNDCPYVLRQKLILPKEKENKFEIRL